MTKVILDTDDPRSLRAVQLVAESATWIEVEPDTRWAIPSQGVQGAFFFVTRESCTCPDNAYRNCEQGCKHRRAVALADIVKAAANLPAIKLRVAA